MLLSLENSGWVVFAFISALSLSASLLTAEHFKARSLKLLFWMRFLALLVLAPMTFFVAPPADPIFYVLLFFNSLFFAYSDVMMFGLSARYGAGIVSRIDPLSVASTFILWTAFVPSLLESYLGSPFRSAGIILSLAGCVVFSMMMRRCDISRNALIRMLPAILAIAAGVILGKEAIQRGELFNTVFYYAFFQALFTTLFYFTILKSPREFAHFSDLGVDGELFNKRLLKAGTIMSIFWAIGTLAKYTAIGVVENPAYVTAIALISPLLILGFYTIKGQRDPARLLPGLGIVFCAFWLIFFSQMI